MAPSPQPGSSHAPTITKVKKHVTMGAQPRQASDQSVFNVYKGVKTFDFCKKTNILATGGWLIFLFTALTFAIVVL